MPTNNLGKSDIATDTTNIWNKEVYHSKRIFLYKNGFFQVFVYHFGYHGENSHTQLDINSWYQYNQTFGFSLTFRTNKLDRLSREY
jgi:hypothetical protein